MPRKKLSKIDEELDESFPASDPPAFMGGDFVGAPARRKTKKKTLRKATRKAEPVKKKSRTARKKFAKRKIAKRKHR